MLLVVGILVGLFVVPEPWSGPVIVVAAAIEATETLFAIWYSRRAAPKVGVETIIGAIGRVTRDCRPSGAVRVRGELWEARCDAGADAGTRVRVRGRDRLTLLVEPIDDEDGLSSARSAGR